jgi:hypothetical protein
MTNKVTFTEVENPMTGEIVAYATIDRGNGEYTSMLKSTYEAQQAEQSTPSLTDEAKAK